MGVVLVCDVIKVFGFYRTECAKYFFDQFKSEKFCFKQKNNYVCAVFPFMRNILFILLVCLSALVSAKDRSKTDTIVNNAMDAAQKYCKLIESYDAKVYMHTNINTLKKSFLYKYTYFVPDFVLYDRKHDEAVIETFSGMHYQYPNNYAYVVTDVRDSLSSKRNIMMLPFNYLNINVYDIVSNDERFLLPVRFETQKYYKYELINSFSENDNTYYIIQFKPVYSSSKLLKGNFTIEDKTWRITNFFGIGNDLFMDLSFSIKMGNDSLKKYLPDEFVIYRNYQYLGNKVQNRYSANINYTNIIPRNDLLKRKSYDIGSRYTLKFDSVPLKFDNALWNEKRRIFFNEDVKIEDKDKDENITENITENIASEPIKSDSIAKKDSKTAQLLAQSMITNTRYRYKKMEFQYSGFFNPNMISYSTQDGLNYRVKLAFRARFPRSKSLMASFSGGYMSKYQDFTADISTSFLYNPRRFGNISLSVGKGNKSFSSSFLEEIQDSLSQKGLRFEDLFLNFYKDYYFKAYHNIEVVNGFQIRAGINYHMRETNEKKNSSFAVKKLAANQMLNERRYFVPTIRFTWTPAQYFKRQGYEKIYISSAYPTFKVELARSFNNFLGSTSEYNRIEVDISQKIPVGLIKSFQYHIGAGMYARQQTEYFADFTFFSRNNYPETWQDGIGGVFNVLPYNIYNASSSYAQAHFMYETPFLLFTLFPKWSRGILSERVYFSQLSTPNVLSYSEIGYGIGNRFVNVALFGSFHKTKFLEMGGKLVFLLGR